MTGSKDVIFVHSGTSGNNTRFQERITCSAEEKGQCGSLWNGRMVQADGN